MFNLPLPPSKLTTTLTLTLAIPLALPLTYLLYLHQTTPKKTLALTTTTGVRNNNHPNPNPNSTTTPLNQPITLPPSVSPPTSPWILAHERVVTSTPLPLSSFPTTNPSTILTHYVRATMTAFSTTPQAYLLWASLPRGSPERGTFDKGYIQGLGFEEGERVNGFWKVGYRGIGPGGGGEERVEMVLDAPEGYKGGREVRGVVVAGVERTEDGEGVRFINETWMWRREDEGKVLLEGAVGGWMHVLLAEWLVGKGVQGVMEAKRGE